MKNIYHKVRTKPKVQ